MARTQRAMAFISLADISGLEIQHFLDLSPTFQAFSLNWPAADGFTPTYACTPGCRPPLSSQTTGPHETPNDKLPGDGMDPQHNEEANKAIGQPISLWLANFNAHGETTSREDFDQRSVVTKSHRHAQ